MHRIIENMEVENINDCNMPIVIATLSCAIADGLSTEQVELLAAYFVMLGDSLAAIAVKRRICENK